MAFHFNWSPLIADTDRVRHMLTSSLNKSPKPPIIVDDIVVNELNLGSNPPSLEILEIGDLAEDRFRGIFKVRYEGDAYLTLRTKVQANPLNTFLSTKPTFASPSPLAAGSGLTIPLQITLSDIRLSGFVILVFSKQKGITLVFRNDPLESLKVSSTFDSIPFVREYLQRTIEGQLRVLFMEDLPAIIHRLSLRVWSEEYAGTGPSAEKEGNVEDDTNGEASRESVDPFASPSLGASEGLSGALFPLDAQGETYASFSQTSLLRLAALTESQRTLSLFTPSIQDTVFRAWASSHERNADNSMHLLHHHPLPTLSRIQSSLNMQHPHAKSRPSLSSAASHTSDAPTYAPRPSLISHASMPTSSTTYSLGSGRPRPHGQRKRKNRVVNLRRHQDGSATDGASDSAAPSSEYDDSASRSESVSLSGSTGKTGLQSTKHSTVPTSSMPSSSIYMPKQREREGEVQTPQSSPQRKKLSSHRRRTSITDDNQMLDGAQSSTLRQRPVTPRHRHPHLMSSALGDDDEEPTPRQSMYLPAEPAEKTAHPKRPQLQSRRQQTLPAHPPKAPALARTSSELSISDLLPSYPFAEGSGHGGSTGGILEQAWMTKMAREIARRFTEERDKADQRRSSVGLGADKGEGFGDTESGFMPPPPAYGS